MAEVMNMPAESLDRRRERPSERKEKSVEDLTPPPPPSQLPPPPPPPARRRDRDSRERRDERDVDMDRPPTRGGGGGAGGGNREYRDRSPPPPPRERDREREYKRRLSPSPPPYRDRRHSPPPFKRSRRDDGYDGRRRSPRGGFGPDDRRFGYDYAGGYERGGVGGRSGYAEDRPHGRYMNRSGGYQGGPSDWDADRAAFNDGSSAAGGSQREGLMSYKQFIQELEDDILPAEAERRYQEYRAEYISTQKRAYFDAHKDEEWLKDKYHPTNLLTVIEKRNEHARKLAKEFLLDLQSGTLDLGPGVTATASGKSGQTSEPNSEDEADGSGKRRRHGRGPAKENDLISAAPKAHPISSDPRRMEVDIEQAQALVRKLDKEKGIEDNVLCSKDHRDKMETERPHGGQIIIVRGLSYVKGLEEHELVDTLVTYLWRIHGLDYYGTVEITEPKGLRHVRVESKNYDEVHSAAGAEWEKKIDLFCEERLRGQDILEGMTGKEKIEAAFADTLEPYVRKIRDEKYGWKYGCGAKGCTKLFHASEFVHKHLRLKHTEVVLELTSKVREDLYFENYMNDKDAPGGQPVMQQPLPKEKPQRRRGPMESRLRDDRPNRRELDGGEDRYDKGDNPPSKTDDPNNDDPMYDNFTGRGATAGGGGNGGPFSSDIPPPPPVLMPVPGAGPLGPFVPAPPEVAMRMLREQGGPSSYEGNGGGSRKGGRMNGPQVVGGPGGPMLGVSPAGFRQDPRRIRSYQDLDAPEDEVTVIDYRSL